MKAKAYQWHRRNEHFSRWVIHEITIQRITVSSSSSFSLCSVTECIRCRNLTEFLHCCMVPFKRAESSRAPSAPALFESVSRVAAHQLPRIQKLYPNPTIMKVPEGTTAARKRSEHTVVRCWRIINYANLSLWDSMWATSRVESLTEFRINWSKLTHKELGLTAAAAVNKCTHTLIPTRSSKKE